MVPNATPTAKRVKRGQIPPNMREGVGASPNYSPADPVDVTPGSPGDKAFGVSMNPAQRGLLTPQGLGEFGAPGQLPGAAPEPPVVPDAPLKALKPVPQTVVRSLGSAFNNAALKVQEEQINATTIRAGVQGGRRHRKKSHKKHGKKSHKKHGKKSHKKHRKTRRRVRFDRI